MSAALAPEAAVVECLNAHCQQPATAILRTPTNRADWPTCDTHEPDMARALAIGQPSDAGSVQRLPVNTPARGSARAWESHTLPPPVRLDWSKTAKMSHPHRCVSCEGYTPLLNPDGEPQHKACAELELDEAMR